MSLLDQLRNSRKSPLVLKTKLIGVRSSRPNVLVFFFEGPDDIPAYEEWISKTHRNLDYEPIHGNGKEQLLALRTLLEGDSLLALTYFFVDSDFDEDDSNDERVFVLNAYSIESLICSRETLDSLLRDEYRCAGTPAVRQRIIADFELRIMELREASLPVNQALFRARRLRARVESKPERIQDFVNVGLRSVTPKHDETHVLVTASLEPNEETRGGLNEIYSRLPINRSMRGKYVLQFFRIWLKLLRDDRRCEAPELFEESFPNLKAEPEKSTIRRLAAQSALPDGLPEFIARASAELAALAA